MRKNMSRFFMMGVTCLSLLFLSFSVSAKTVEKEYGIRVDGQSCEGSTCDFHIVCSESGNSEWLNHVRLSFDPASHLDADGKFVKKSVYYKNEGDKVTCPDFSNKNALRYYQLYFSNDARKDCGNPCQFKGSSMLNTYRYFVFAVGSSACYAKSNLRYNALLKGPTITCSDD